MAIRQLEDSVRTLQLRLSGFLQQLGVVAPVGKIDAYAGATAPEGWLLCDGSAVSRSTYPQLFAALGTVYGAGNGSTTFNLPNAKGRVLVGRDTLQTEFNTLGETGGAKTHTLSEGEMPSHTHPPAAGSLFYHSGIPRSLGGTGVGAFDFAVSQEATGARGGGQAHNNLQPYLTVNYIIRAG